MIGLFVNLMLLPLKLAVELLEVLAKLLMPRARRPRLRARGNQFSGGEVLVLGVLVLLALAVTYWYIALPLLLVGGVVAYFVITAAQEQREQATAAWLAAPPPPLVLPGRFTENWFAANVPQLHPGQLPALEHEMRSRGWSQERIEERLAPYLTSNRHLSPLLAEDHDPTYVAS